MSHIPACLNCATPIRQGPHCESCGQRNVHSRLVFRDLCEDVKVQVLEWHLPWLNTMRAMLLHPGAVCRDYMDGKRARYVNPLKYFVYLTTIALLVLQALPARYGLDPTAGLPRPTNFRAPDVGPIGAFLAESPILVCALFVPLAAILFRLLYSRARYNNTEVCCFILYSLGNAVLLAFPIHLLVQVVGDSWLNIPLLSQDYFVLLLGEFMLIAAVVFIHTSYAASTFFGEAWYWSWLKVFCVYLLYGLATAGTLTYLNAEVWVPAAERAVVPTYSLNAGLPWEAGEQMLVAGLDTADGLFAYTDLTYGNFLLNAGRTSDALYRLLRARDTTTLEAGDAQFHSLLLAVAYLQRGQLEFAASQLAGLQPLERDNLQLELALIRGQPDAALEAVRSSVNESTLNRAVAEAWASGDVAGALTQIRLAAGTPGIAQGQLANAARWAAALGDPALAWALFARLDSSALLWPSLWMPYFAEVRALPDFKQFLRVQGLPDYWRSTGNWADKCRPLGAADFECF